MQLQSGSLLQGGKYRIERVLGQGGFGITYQAVQVALNRKVAIKEFFMKEYCNRDSETSHVSVPSEGSKELVGKFRQKFIKEAQNIAALNHPHIIRIHDVFEENGTAYYVMEFWDNGSLADLVKRQGALDEVEALRYIRQVADALGYIHDRKMNHLDVKPGNILLDENRNAVLIDFGLSKRYDEEGNQTSTTPVGISHGYAPMEQYKKGGVGTFSPATDIYSLGATLYKLITGNTPPEANDVMDDGLPALPSSVSSATASAIEKAMQPTRRNRPQSVKELLGMLDAEPVEEEESEDTELVVVDEPTPQPEPVPVPLSEPKPASGADPIPVPTSSWKKWAVPLAAGVLVVLAMVLFLSKKDESAVAANENSASSSKANVINGHAYVDMGLSVKWADRNVGASSPSDYGSYFAWGEVRTKSEYTEGNSLTVGKDFPHIYGNIQYDAARVNWGGNWRLPTEVEVEELRNQCVWTWTSQNGHNGYKIVGPNGNSIFLPAAGYYVGSICRERGERGDYWSGSMDRDANAEACSLSFDEDDRGDDDWYDRYRGFTVRPVLN